jgi:hypothetical protein
MADPRRWLDDDQASRAAVDLLRVIDPPKAAPAAVRGALAKQLAGMVATGGAKAAASVGWVKLTLVSVAVVGAGSGVTAWSIHRSANRASVSQVELSAPAPEASPLASTAAPENEMTLPVETAGPHAAERPRPMNASGAPAEPRDRLAEEEAILEEARKTLAQDPAHALTLLRRHQTRFPSGELTAERMYLSVDCLSRLGKRAAAKREADALVDRYPNSAYARRAPLLLTAPGR